MILFQKLPSISKKFNPFPPLYFTLKGEYFFLSALFLRKEKVHNQLLGIIFLGMDSISIIP